MASSCYEYSPQQHLTATITPDFHLHDHTDGQTPILLQISLKELRTVSS